MSKADDSGLLPRVKLVPVTSTWTCPTCERQNVYRQGIVSDPQDKCFACGTQVIPSAVRADLVPSTSPPAPNEHAQGLEAAAQIAFDAANEFAVDALRPQEQRIHKANDYWQRAKGAECVMERIRARVTSPPADDSQPVPAGEQEDSWRRTKPYKEHLRERLTTIEDFVGYLSACHDDGSETFQLGVRDVVEFSRTPSVSPSEDELRGWIVPCRGGSVENRQELESLGVKVGDYDATKNEYADCVVSLDALSRLDPLWGKYIWGLEPAKPVAGDEEAIAREKGD